MRNAYSACWLSSLKRRLSSDSRCGMRCLDGEREWNTDQKSLEERILDLRDLKKSDLSRRMAETTLFRMTKNLFHVAGVLRVLALEWIRLHLRKSLMIEGVSQGRVLQMTIVLLGMNFGRVERKCSPQWPWRVNVICHWKLNWVQGVIGSIPVSHGVPPDSSADPLEVWDWPLVKIEQWSEDPSGGLVEQECREDKLETYTWSISELEWLVILVGSRTTLERWKDESIDVMS